MTLGFLQPVFLSRRNKSLLKIIRPDFVSSIVPPPLQQRRNKDDYCRLAMGGLLDSFSKFLNDRDGDFVKLEDSVAEYGPGPMLLLYNMPDGIDDDEIQDMLSDTAPIAHKKKCRICRLSKNQNDFLDLSLQESLERAAKGQVPALADDNVTSDTEATFQDGGSIPVLFFSGFRDDEMLAMHNLLAQEMYEETGGQMYPACAKAVPNAMSKPLRQVLEEISGDHREAIQIES